MEVAGEGRLPGCIWQSRKHILLRKMFLVLASKNVKCLGVDIKRNKRSCRQPTRPVSGPLRAQGLGRPLKFSSTQPPEHNPGLRAMDSPHHLLCTREGDRGS